VCVCVCEILVIEETIRFCVYMRSLNVYVVGGMREYTVPFYTTCDGMEDASLVRIISFFDVDAVYRKLC